MSQQHLFGTVKKNIYIYLFLALPLLSETPVTCPCPDHAQKGKAFSQHRRSEALQGMGEAWC